MESERLSTTVDLLGVLSAEGQLTVGGVGTFQRHERPARAGQNPRTGEAIEEPARVMIKFTADPALKEWIDGGCAGDPPAAAGPLGDATRALFAELREGRPSSLAEIGRFGIVEFQARFGRNPQTGAPIEIPARRALKFFASSWAIATIAGQAAGEPLPLEPMKSLLDVYGEPLAPEALLPRFVLGGLPRREDGEAWARALEAERGRLPAMLRSLEAGVRLGEGSWPTPRFFEDIIGVREAVRRFAAEMPELPQEPTLVPLAQEPGEGYWAAPPDEDDPEIFGVDQDGFASGTGVPLSRWLSALAFYGEVRQALADRHASMALSVAVEERMIALAPEMGLTGSANPAS